MAMAIKAQAQAQAAATMENKQSKEVKAKAKGKGRKALAEIANADAQMLANDDVVVLKEADKENVNDMLDATGVGAGLKKSRSKVKAKAKNNKAKTEEAASAESVEDDIEVLKKALEKLQIENEQSQKLIHEQEALLKQKDEQIHRNDLEREKLQSDITRLKKSKGFNPSLPNLSLNENEKKKDENKIKRPSSAYILWCQEQWKQVRSENPDAVFKEVGAILGSKWKTLSEEEKKPYEEKYEQEKKDYLQVVGQEKRETEAFKLFHDDQKQKTALELLEQYLQHVKEVEGDRKGKKPEKDPLKPKKPISAYLAFCNDKRAAMLAEKHSLVEISKILGKQWKEMTEEEKAPFEEIAAEAKLKYEQEMEQYKQTKAEEQSSFLRELEFQKKLEKEQGLQLLRKKEKVDALVKTKAVQKKQSKKEDVDPNKPKKPPTSFLLFSKEERKNLTGVDNSKVNAILSVKWKELDEETRKIWTEKAATAMIQYRKDMEQYKQAANLHKD